MTWKDGAPIVEFKTVDEWEVWLETHHKDKLAVWIRYYKKASGKATITYDQALEVALCYGWIDGVVNAYDEESYLQRYTPRRKKSIWSKRNTEHVERLAKAGKMRPAGLAEVEAAKNDGRWKAAYSSPVNIKIPPDFLQELAKNKKAKAYFDTLNKANVYAIAYRLTTAKKPETIEQRKKQIIEMLTREEKFH